MIKEKVEEQNERTVKMNQKELAHKNERKVNMKNQEKRTNPSPEFVGFVNSPTNSTSPTGGEVKRVAKTQEKQGKYCPPLVGGPKSLISRRGNKKAAFTLAETLITLTILGVVAAITVPSLINKQIESANRTKLKKAMTVYEKAINQMVIDEDVKGSLNTVEGFKTTDNCSKSRPYFKTVENGDDNCKFKTADRVWWDITDIENPIIAFNKGDLKAATAADANTKKAFYLIGRRDDSGILRINDKGFEDSITSGNDTRIAEMQKLYNFINKVETTSGGVTPVTPLQKTIAQQLAECSTSTCQVITSYDCEKTSENPEGACYANLNQKNIAEAKAINLTKNGYDEEFCSYEKNDQGTYVETCGVTSTVSAGNIWISDQLTLAEDDAKSDDNCNESRDKDDCKANGDYWILAKRTCEKQGMRLPTAAELKAMYQTNSSQLGSNYYWAAETIDYYGDRQHYAHFIDSSGYLEHDTFFSVRTPGIDISAVCVGN